MKLCVSKLNRKSHYLHFYSDNTQPDVDRHCAESSYAESCGSSEVLCCADLYPVVYSDEYLFLILLYIPAGSGLALSHPRMPNIHRTIQR